MNARDCGQYPIVSGQYIRIILLMYLQLARISHHDRHKQ